MSKAFSSLVELIRLSSSHAFEDFTLRLVCQNAPKVRGLIEQIESWKAPIYRVSNAKHFGDLESLPDGTTVEFEFVDLSGNSKLVIQNLAELLKFQGGQFQSGPPDEYYLVDEKFATDDQNVPERVASYLRMPRLLKFLRDVADAELPTGSQSKLIFLAGKKLEIPINYDASDVRNVPPEAEIEDFHESIQSKPQSGHKKELLKRVLIRTLQDVPENQRFARMLASFAELRRSFGADLDHYLSEFDFEKLRDQFERKRLDYMLKINATVGELLSKILAIPIAQGLVVSQLKPDNGFANVALIIGSGIFTLIGMVLVVSHSHTLREVRREVTREREETQAKYPKLHERIDSAYKAVQRRAGWFTSWIVVLTFVLLVVGFVFSLAGFDQSSPCNGCISSFHFGV